MEGSIGLGDPWSVYAGLQQASRRKPYEVERLLGRYLCPTPTHLSRALYVPFHQSNNTFHLLIYDISQQYKERVGTIPIGSSMYTVKLSTMIKPNDHRAQDVNVQYLAEADKASTGLSTVTVRRSLPVKRMEDEEMKL